MPLATFKDFCLDAVDAASLGRFWGAALGLEVFDQPNGDAGLDGATVAERVWINQVPEPKTVKQRIHLDVHTGSIGELVDLGATVIDGESFRWTLMADPEGHEFCAFVRDEPPAYRLFEIVVDCADHASTSAWWHALLGGVRHLDDRGFSYLRDVPNAPFEALTFLPVPEPKTVKNRIHLDVTTDDLAPLLDAGATLLRARDDEIRWNVMADPEGNEFCAFVVEPDAD